MFNATILNYFKFFIRFSILSIFCCGIALPSYALNETTRVLSTPLKGPIGVGAERHLLEAIEEAEEKHYDLLLIELDTPGGLYKTTRDMAQAILNAPIPIVIYVAPSGAHAASAGFFLVYSADIAAMAPATNLGSATPVDFVGRGYVKEKDDTKGKGKGKSKEASQNKVLNDAVAFIKSLAEENKRSQKYAIKGVTEALNLSASEALRYGVINFIADSKEELIEKMDGTVVKVQDKNITLQTKEFVLDTYEPDFKTTLIKIMTDPNMIIIFLMIGFYGLLLEFYNPGMFVPGVLGALCLFLALWGMSILPTNYFGVAFMLLGLTFMLAELYVPSFGILGIGGIFALGFGIYILFDHPSFRVAPEFLITFLGATSAVIFLLIGYVIRTHKQKAMVGIEKMVGKTVTVLSWSEDKGHVRYEGVIWKAELSTHKKRTLKKGESVTIKSVKDLVIKV